MIRQDPADSSDSRRCSDNTIQRNLPNLDKRHGGRRSIDDEVVQNVLVGIYK